ncbi:MAG TPA: MipA/OmpV family protein [Azospirillaceae bacterium]|nr:MipA/OmpV family protein [Azospirillaceae bacterium]
MTRPTRLPVWLALSTVLAVPAAAQQLDPPSDGWNVRLGLVGVAAPDYEGSDEYELHPVPDIEITYGDWFFLDRRGLGVNLLQWNGLTAGVSYGIDAGRREKENDALEGLGTIRATAMGNIFATYQVGPVSLSADIQRDLLDRGHEGTTAQLALTYALPIGPGAAVFAGPSLTWADDNYMQSFFGISAEQALRSGRVRHDVKAGLKNAGFTVYGTYPLSGTWSLTGLAGYSRLLGEAADSPLVRRDGDADQFFGGLGASYRF